MNFDSRNLPSVILGVLSVVAVVLLLALFGNYYWTDLKSKPTNLRLSNITANGATISWTTGIEVNAKLRVREIGGEWDNEIYYDDRDLEQNTQTGEYELKPRGSLKRKTHHVSLRALEPEKEYEFMILGSLNNFTQDMDGESFPRIQTTTLNSELVAPDPMYGTVLHYDLSVAPPTDGIVYYQLYTPGELQVRSKTYSTVLNGSSSWSGDVANVMTVNDDKFVPGESTIINISVVTSVGTAEKSFALKSYKPLPMIFVEERKEETLAQSSSSFDTFVLDVVAAPIEDPDPEQKDAKDQTSGDGTVVCTGDSCEAGGQCWPQGFVAENTSTGTGDPIGTYECVHGSWVFLTSEITQDVSDSSDFIDPKTGEICTDTTPIACKEDYKETCNLGDGTLGVRKCHKEGTSPCGVSGPSCTWGPGSSCGKCEAAQKGEVPELEDYASDLLAAYPVQEVNSATEGTGVFDELEGDTLQIAADVVLEGLLSKGNVDGPFCEDVNSPYYGYAVGCKYLESIWYGSEDDAETEVYRHTILDDCSVNSQELQSDNWEKVDSEILAQYNYPNYCYKVDSNADVQAGDVNPENFGSNCIYFFDEPCSDMEEQELFTVGSTYIYYHEEEDDTYTRTTTLITDIDDSDGCEFYETYKYDIASYDGDLCSPKLQADSSRFASESRVLGVSLVESVSAASDKLTTTESGDYVVYYGDNFERPISEFAVNLDGAEKAEIRLFIDTNGNGKKDKDEPVLEDYTQISLKKDSEVATYNLNAGWNLITMPLISSDGVSTASEMLDHFNKQGADIKHIARYTDSGFEMYTKRENDQEFSNDFNIVPGQGYFVLNYEAKKVKIKGRKFDEAVPFRVRNGWNLVGVYTNERAYTAESLINDMNKAGIKADVVSKYDGGLYTSIVYEEDLLYGNDYNIFERAGYFIRVQEGGGADVKFTPEVASGS